MSNTLSPTPINVEIAYATQQTQTVIALQVPAGTSAEKAILASGILQQFPDIDLSKNKLGIYGKLITLQAELGERDRVEIYRPLIADPKEVRKQRVTHTKFGKSKRG